MLKLRTETLKIFCSRDNTLLMFFLGVWVCTHTNSQYFGFHKDINYTIMLVVVYPFTQNSTL